MTFKISAKVLARKRNIDVASLIDILSYRRPHDSEGEMEFVQTTLDTIDGMQRDPFGNRFIRVPNADGSQSNVMWSCHVDTVHGPIKDGIIRQNIKWDTTGNKLGLNEGKPGQCLGADDGAGLWLLLEMLKVGKPGLYIFHRGEERGGLGSRWIERETPELVDGIDFAIAFDRKDVSSVITHQGSMRCCSDAFGKSFGAALDRIEGLKMKLDTTGSFTDTDVYTDLVAECTNISVGYDWAHGPRETLDVMHMIRLWDAMMLMDPQTDLVIERKAGDREQKSWSSNNWSGYGFGHNTTPKQITHQPSKAFDEDAYNKWLEENFEADDASGESTPETMFATLLRMVSGFPHIAVKLLMDMGVDQWDFADATLQDAWSREDDADLAGAGEPEPMPDDRTECVNCCGMIDKADITEDMRCPFCYGSLVDPVGEALATNA